MRLNKEMVMDYQKFPERIIQFGEGNFLRAFVDWMVNEMNDKADFESSVVLVQPIERGMVDEINKQDGLYTLVMKGLKNGMASFDTQLIQSVSRGINPYSDFKGYLKLAENPDMRFIVSNTTEAGIAFSADDKQDMTPPRTFPGKLTVLLYHRYKTFKGDKNKGFIILPCELIDRNGDNLKKAVLQYCQLWNLEIDFQTWLAEANVFCNTLVDRIVPGYPADTAKEIEGKVGYEDKLIVEGEPFHLWVIEGPEWISNELPAHKANLNVLFVNDMTPYRTRKVRILNGAHTVMTPVAYLSGIETVREAVEHPLVGEYINQTLHEEIIPTLDLSREELVNFAASVHERFLNPYVKHSLMSISLNSMSKFKARVLPSLTEYKKRKGNIPALMSFSFAALLAFYSGKNGNQTIALKDDDYVLSLFNTLWGKYNSKEITADQLVTSVLKDTMLWGEDLSTIQGLAETTSSFLKDILKDGVLQVLDRLMSQKALQKN
ncbi:MAG TPA: tagaturonate reductase [Bacteroidales bacterium]|nr:tagaturonate reductase [Bacteroidales bacterium]